MKKSPPKKGVAVTVKPTRSTKPPRKKPTKARATKVSPPGTRTRARADAILATPRRQSTALARAPDIAALVERVVAIARYSFLSEHKQLFAAKYLTYLPTGEELRRELERDRRLAEASAEAPHVRDRRAGLRELSRLTQELTSQDIKKPAGDAA